MTTPDLPGFAAPFARQLRRLRATGGPCLHQLEALCAPWIPRHLLAAQDEGPHSRTRCWPLRLAFWTFSTRTTTTSTVGAPANTANPRRLN